MVAMTDQAKHASGKLRKMGVCMVVSSFRPLPPPESLGEFVVDAEADAALYLIEYEHREVTEKASTIVLTPPMHGTLSDDGDGTYIYIPNPAYVGKDSATIEVNHSGIKVRVIYDFRDFNRGIDTNESNSACGKKRPYWKISSSGSINSGLNALASRS